MRTETSPTLVKKNTQTTGKPDERHPRKRLTLETLNTATMALDCRSKSLQDLHWRAVAMGATDPLYRNIAKEIAKIDKAKEQLAELFESQFEESSK